MRIEYAENPIATKVFLTANEKKLLFWNYIYTNVEDSVWNLKVNIEPIIEGEGYNLLKVPEHRKEYIEKLVGDPLRSMYNELKFLCDSMMETQYKEETIGSFVEALQSSHDGDCIKQPCSCLKCWAEDILDINTLDSCPSPHSVFWSFWNKETEKYDLSIEQAISNLETTDYKDLLEKEPSYVKYVPRWIENNKKATEYLRWYKVEKLGTICEL